MSEFRRRANAARLAARAAERKRLAATDWLAAIESASGRSLRDVRESATRPAAPPPDETPETPETKDDAR